PQPAQQGQYPRRGRAQESRAATAPPRRRLNVTYEDTLRLFFALPCPPEQAAATCDWRDRQSLGGRPVPLENLHLTLAFLGAQPEADLEAIRQLAADIVSPGFEL